MLIFSSNVFAKTDEWKSYIDKTCETTITGKARKIINNKKFWIAVVASMDTWAESMSMDNGEKSCYGSEDSASDILKCRAFYKEQWDWYSRCRPVAVSECLDAGGFCR